MPPILGSVRERLRPNRSRDGTGVSLSGPRRDELRRALDETANGRGGELSAARRAAMLAALYDSLSMSGRHEYLGLLAAELGVTQHNVDTAIEALVDGREDPSAAAQRGRAALVPPSNAVLRQFNLLPQGTKFLVDLRADLLELCRSDRSLVALERDLKTLLADWFDSGFLSLRRITWGSSAALLERLAESEAVHAVTGWADLKNRLDPSDRRFFAFFHPQMPEEPLIFVQVALTRGLATEIDPLLDPAGRHEEPARADTAIFYSISNSQPGLAGISLGSFLIKRVVDELASEFPKLKRFATLSPVPDFRRWLEDEGHARPEDDPVARCAAYLLREKRSDGRVLDQVANFHLSNGARIERVNPDADSSERGRRQSLGIMVNYLYVLDEIESNHEAYASEHIVAASSTVTRLARTVGPQRRRE